MCITRSANVCWAGVGLKPNLSSGIAFAMVVIVLRVRSKSACTSQVSVVHAVAPGRACAKLVEDTATAAAASMHTSPCFIATPLQCLSRLTNW